MEHCFPSFSYDGELTVTIGQPGSVVTEDGWEAAPEGAPECTLNSFARGLAIGQAALALMEMGKRYCALGSDQCPLGRCSPSLADLTVRSVVLAGTGHDPQNPGIGIHCLATVSLTARIDCTCRSAPPAEESEDEKHDGKKGKPPGSGKK